MSTDVRLGLGRCRIAALVRAAPATVGYHLGRTRHPPPPSRACSRTDLDTVAGTLRLARQDQLIGKELAKESL